MLNTLFYVLTLIPWLCPPLWPVLVLYHLSSLLLRPFTSLVHGAGGAGAPLNASGCWPPLVLLAWLTLRAGELLHALGRTAADRADKAEGGGSASMVKSASVDVLYQTPGSSPPPFDLVSPQDREEGRKEESDADSRESRPLSVRERLRNIGSTIAVVRRLGISSMLYESYRGSGGARTDQANLRLGINRSMRAYNLFEEIRQDYLRTMRSLPEREEEREQVMKRVHERSARKCLELARTNGGLYTKAAQFVASLQGGAGDKGIPKPYVDVLRVLTDAAPAHEFAEMESVIVRELGGPASELFGRFDEVPIAAASLAQVHRAELQDGTEVAVKILYPSLRREMASDFAMFRRLGSQIRPGGHDMGWLVEDFERTLRSELDCEHEARNCELAARLLAGREQVRFPRVMWSYTRKDILVMQFMHGLLRISEPEALRAAGLEQEECGQLVSDVLTELALVHGCVHGDPHAGNIYLVAEEAEGRTRPALVMLDHGLYHHVDERVRRDLCKLFLACIARDKSEIQRLSHKCVGPLHRFFPLLLSPWFVLGTSLSYEDVQAAKDNKLPPSVSGKDVSDAMTSLHMMEGNILGVLHSFGYVRGLLNCLNFGERRRLKSIARIALLGLAPPDIAREALLHGDRRLPWSWRFRLWRAKFNVEVTAGMLQVLAIATSSELQTEHVPWLFAAVASLLLSLGRNPLLLFVVRLLGIACEFGTSEPAREESMPGASREEEDHDDVVSRAESDIYYQLAASSPMTQDSDSFYKEEEVMEEWVASKSEPLAAARPPVNLAGVLSTSRRGVVNLVTATLRRVARREEEQTSGSQASMRARRLRHFSPTRSGAKRPWV